MVSVVLKLETENEEVMNRMPREKNHERERKKKEKRDEVRLEKISFSVILYLHRLKKTEACISRKNEGYGIFFSSSTCPCYSVFPFFFLHSVMTEMSRHGCGIAEVTHLPCT